MSSFRYVLRRLRHTPGFTFIALLTLALGIGANTAIFSVVNGVLLKPLPYPDSESLISVAHLAPGVPGVTSLPCSPTMYFTYREQSRTFQDFGIWNMRGVSITKVAQPQQVFALEVSKGLLEALGVQAATGRRFSDADVQPGAARTVILTSGYWQEALGGKSDVVGQTLMVDNQPHQIIGVLPEEFRFLNTAPPRILLPMQWDRSAITLGDFSYQGIARLKPGVTLEQANADIARMLPLWLQAWPAPKGFPPDLLKNARFAPRLRSLKTEVIGDVGDSLWVLMAAIGVVLLIACANIANLLLVRAEGRQQEFAIRAALGAGWGRIAREMLLESLMLGLAGGALGFAMADAAIRALVAAGVSNLPRLNEIHTDGTVFAFGLAASLLSALLFGLAPMWKYATPHLGTALRAGGRSVSDSRERHHARNSLVITQVALAMVLLVGAGLMIRTFQALRAVDPGFSKPDEIQIVRVALPEALIPERDRVVRIEQAMLEKFTAIPGVTAAGFAGSILMDGSSSNDVFQFEDLHLPPGTAPANRRRLYVSPGQMETLRTPLEAGRSFNWQDMRPDRDVMIVSRQLAIEVYGSPQAAVGKRMRESPTDPWSEIVGVAGDVHDRSVVEPPVPTVYMPTFTRPSAYRPGLVRTPVFAIRSSRVGTEAFVKEVRQAIASVQPDLPIFGIRTMGELYSQSMARTSFTLVMLGIAGGMALLLGVVGIYGVIAYAVTQRTREIGIRVALGAEPRALQAMFVRQGMVLAVVGIAIGLAVSAGLTRWMASILYGVNPLDPVTFAAVPLVLAMAVAAASYLPARRTSRVDPMLALRA